LGRYQPHPDVFAQQVFVVRNLSIRLSALWWTRPACLNVGAE